MKTKLIVTYASPTGERRRVCHSCERRLLAAGEWPRDRRGVEFVDVSHGLHRGACDTHRGGLTP